MDRDEVKIVTIEAAPGATILKLQKGERFNPYAKYTFDVIYVLEDGRRVETTDDHSLLRDAKAELASLPKAPRWEMTAIFDEHGRLSMTSTHIGLLSGARS